MPARRARDPASSPRSTQKRGRLEEQLEALEQACAAPESPEAAARLRGALREGPALVAARAGKVIRERGLDGFAADLEAAFRRFLADPVKSDPGCPAKLAALEALDFGGHGDAAVFLEAVRHVQLEPAWGPPVDTAVGVRARGVLALSRLGHPDLAFVAGTLLADAASPVRQAAADALAATGDAAHAGPLALRFAAGDEDPLVALACASGLLALVPGQALPRLRAALAGADESAREVAALALGQSTREEALDLLLAHLESAPLASDRAVALRALGLQRNDRALRALLEVVAAGSLADAEAALAGLGARRFDAGVRDRARAAVAESQHAGRLAASLAAAFPGDQT
jgi:HEAT repeat protein